MGFKGVKIIQACFREVCHESNHSVMRMRNLRVESGKQKGIEPGRNIYLHTSLDFNLDSMFKKNQL